MTLSNNRQPVGFREIDVGGPSNDLGLWIAAFASTIDAFPPIALRLQLDCKLTVTTEKPESQSSPGLTVTAQLVLLTSTLVAATALTLIFFLYQLSTQVTLTLERERLGHSISLAARQFEMRLEGSKRNVIALSSVPPLKALIETRANGGLYDGANEQVWQHRLTTIFSGMLRANPEYTQLRFIGRDDQGREIVRVNRLADGSLQTVDDSNLQPKGKRPYVQNTLKLQQGELYLSRFELNREHGRIDLPHRPTFRIATPVFLDDSTLVGIIVVNIDATIWFRNICDAAPKASTFLLTNNEGDYLTHPDAAKTFGFDLNQRFRLTDDFPSMASVYQNVATGIQFGTEKENVISAIRIPLTGNVNNPFLVLTAVADHADVFTYSLRVRNWSIIVTLILVALAVAVVTIAARYLVRPLQEISLAAKRVSGGDLNSRVPHPGLGCRELHEVAQSFNRMLDDLNSVLVSREKLEAEVEQRNAAEKKLLANAQELQRANEQLDKERSALVAANISLEQFVNVASHDLRSPIRGMGSLAGFVLEDVGESLSPNSVRHLEQIQKRVDAMNRMLDGLLQYARTTADDGLSEPVDVREMLEEIVDTLAMPNEMHIKLPTDLPIISTRATPLSLVLRNLIDNAIKHHGRDDGVIEITYESIGSRVRFTVCDDGPGIDPIHHERIFSLFQRLRTENVKQGSGLGLALVQRTILAHGGTLELDSAVGRGAAFSFTWPVEESFAAVATDRTDVETARSQREIDSSSDLSGNKLTSAGV